jgi:hypothetical protein
MAVLMASRRSVILIVFSLQGYFDYIFNILRFDISTHVETQYHHSKEYQILENIYSQLKTKSK